MVTKKQQKQEEAIKRLDDKIVQMALDRDCKKAALGMNIRKARVAQFCQIGGDAESAGLSELDRQVRMGAFLLIADQLGSDDFIKTCRERARLEMKRRTGREPAVELARDAAAVSPEKSRETGAPLPEQVSEDEEGERLVVRFKGAIGGLGRRLRSLGLEYSRDQQQWSGTAVRTEVVREIEASQYANLVESIQPAVSSRCDVPDANDPGAQIPEESIRPAADPDIDVEFEVDMEGVDQRSPSEIWMSSIIGVASSTRQ